MGVERPCSILSGVFLVPCVGTPSLVKMVAKSWLRLKAAHATKPDAAQAYWAIELETPTALVPIARRPSGCCPWVVFVRFE